jgi:hypothetical protein
MLSLAVPGLRSRWQSLRLAVPGQRLQRDAVPGRRGLQICLGLVWLLDAALQCQPFMFGPFFVTQGILPATAGNPLIVAGPATWASHLMLRHIVVYNAIFATVQLLIAAGIFCRRTLRPALAASIAWALFVWWFGESLGGILTGSSPLAGVPGAVVLYALIAVMLWPAARAPAHPASPATSGPLGARAANLLWLALWGSFSYYLLLPDNRSPDAIAGLFSVTDGQPGWIVSIMNGVAGLAGQRGIEISVVLAVLCALAGCGVFAQPTLRPALAVATALGLLFWIAEGLGGIFTGQGTDPSTGPLLILLAASFWPRLAARAFQGGHPSAAGGRARRGAPVPGTAAQPTRSGTRMSSACAKSVPPGASAPSPPSSRSGRSPAPAAGRRPLGCGGTTKADIPPACYRPRAPSGTLRSMAGWKPCCPTRPFGRT